MRVLRSLLVSGSAAVMAGALTFTGGTVATTATARHALPSARFLTEARSALLSYLRHNHPGALWVHPGRTLAGVRGTTKSLSFNWAGYADTSTKHGAFTKVRGSWTTPKVSCHAEDQLTSDWVGLDGATRKDQTVEQDGTLGWCYRGKALYFTWYEMFPADNVTVGKSLRPGDKISASVTRKGTSYKLALTDSTHTANSFSVTKSCPATQCFNMSAEWIAERPAFNFTGIAPLAKYGTVKFTNGARTENGKSGKINSGTNESINMLDSTEKYNLTTVSGLSGGNSFSAAWHNSY